MSWEMALGTYWLPRLAVLLLSIGVVWGLTLAVQRWGQAWLPYIRVGTGYAIAVGLFLGGKIIERRRRTETQELYVDYARVMMAAGLALLYFVTYATHYVPYTRIIPRPEITLALLTGIVLWWGFVANLRRSWNLAFIVTALGHFTVALSTLTLAQPPRLAVLGLLVLSIGAAFFVARHGWLLLGLCAALGSYGNYYLWLANSPPSGTIIAYATAMLILAAYWLIFAVAEYVASARDDAPARLRLRNLYVGVNSGAVLTLGWGLTESFDFSRDHSHLFLFGLTAVLLLFGIFYFKTRTGDVLYGAYLTKASAVAALGLADYFEGAALTFSLAVEAVVLLYSARRTSLLAPRVLAILLAALAFAHGIWVAGTLYLIDYTDDVYWQQAASVAATLAAFLYAAVFYQHTAWPRLPVAATRWPGMNRLLVWLGFAGEDRPSMAQPLPYFFAIAGTILAACHLHTLFPREHIAAPAALLAMVIAGAGVVAKSKPLTIASALLTVCSIIWWHRQALYMGRVSYGSNLYWESLSIALATVISLLLLSELCRVRSSKVVWWWGQPIGEKPALLQRLYSIAAAELICASALVFVEPGSRTLILMAIAAAASYYGLLFAASNIGLSGLLVFLFGVVVGAIEIMVGIQTWQAAAALAVAAAVSVLAEPYLSGREGLRFHQKPLSPFLLYAGTAMLGALYIQETASPVPGVYLLLVAAIVAVALLHVLHQRAWTAIATALFVWSALDWFSLKGNFDSSTWSVAAWCIAGAALAAGRYFTVRRIFVLPVPEAILVITSWACLLYQTQADAAEGYYYAAWMMVALALLVYGGTLRIYVAVVLSLFTAAATTLALLIGAYDSLGVGARVAGLGAATVYWFVLERGHAIAVRRHVISKQLADPVLRATLVAIPPLLLVILLERYPLFSSFYLTIAWTMAAVVVMAIGAISSERYYRYAALCIFTLALGRVMLIDTQRLDALYRIAAVIFLGIVLLAVGYGYIKAREKSAQVSETKRIDDPPAEDITTDDREI